MRRALIAVLSVLASSGTARAEEGDVPAVPERPKFRSFALELNPLAVALGRYSFNAEFMTGRHIAVVASPFLRYAGDSDVPTLDKNPKTVAGGLETSLRYYSSPDGPMGFFIGPSIIFGAVSGNAFLEFDTFGNTSGPSGQTKRGYVGFALDLGGQWISASGFVIGGGLGVGTMDDMPWLQGKIFPRALFSIGQAF